MYVDDERMQTDLKISKTCRGFDLIEFTDSSLNKCSLQKSSRAFVESIWLGLEEPDIMEFYPMPRDTDESWFKITKEDLEKLKHRPQNELTLNARMHLTQEQVKALLPYLQRFAETGELV